MLNGTVNPHGASTAVTFEYGTTTGYGSTITAAQSPLTGGTAQSVSGGITGLNPGITYHFRVKAVNSLSTTYGDDQTFTTLAALPTTTTASATSIASGSATLNGTVNPNAAATTVTFDYGITVSYGSSLTAIQNPLTGTASQAVSASLTGLTPGTTYHFRAKAANSVGTTNGSDQSFVYPAVAPTVVTGSASTVSLTTATLSGTVNPYGTSTTYYFEYGTTSSYGSITGLRNAGSGWSDTSVDANILGLSPNTIYHYRLVATNNTGTTDGQDQTFTTSFIYVNSDGNCGNKTPCHSTIQAAIDAAIDGSTILIADGIYSETITLNAAKTLTLKGGWDVSFETQIGNTILRNAPKVPQGSLTFQMLSIKP